MGPQSIEYIRESRFEIERKVTLELFAVIVKRLDRKQFWILSKKKSGEGRQTSLPHPNRFFSLTLFKEIAMSKPKTSHKRTDTFKYVFKLYLEDGEKWHSDFYTLEGIKEMKATLKKDKQVFTISEVAETNEVNEISI
jgi:hypothetical protein